MNCSEWHYFIQTNNNFPFTVVHREQTVYIWFSLQPYKLERFVLIKALILQHSFVATEVQDRQDPTAWLYTRFAVLHSTIKISFLFK